MSLSKAASVLQCCSKLDNHLRGFSCKPGLVSGRDQDHTYCVCSQDLLRQVIESGALSHLDSDQQWSLRMLLPRQEKVTFKPVLPNPAYTPMQGQAGTALPPPAQLTSNTDQMTTLLAALLKPQAPSPQVSLLLAPAICQIQLEGLMDIGLAGICAEGVHDSIHNSTNFKGYLQMDAGDRYKPTTGTAAACCAAAGTSHAEPFHDASPSPHYW